MKRRRLYSERVPLDALLEDRALLRLLAGRGVQLIAAVQPDGLGHVPALVERAAGAGLALGLWPMLDDDEGRWLHPGNATRFEEFVVAVSDAAWPASPDPRPGATLVLDLEPPIDDVRRATHGHLESLSGLWRRALDDAPHRRMVARLRERGVESLATAIPMAASPGRSGRGYQRALGTPLAAGYDTLSAMLYTSLFEGYGFGVVRRRDARALLARFTRDLCALAGSGALAAPSVSLGAVGVGALGDEAVLREPAELADDVAIVRALGVDDLALFDLAGVLARPPVEAWLDALIDTPASGRPAPTTRRAQAIVSLARVTGVALDLRRATG